MERIPLTSPDSELVEASHVRLKHAKELLDVDPTQFMYSGEVSEFSLHASDARYASQWIIFDSEHIMRLMRTYTVVETVYRVASYKVNLSTPQRSAKNMQILLSRTQAVPGRTSKQEQE